jgi:hypothetical protein
LVSVNNKSLSGLAALKGCSKASLETAKGYREFIGWIMNQNWWSVPEPEDSEERELWLCRAALLDAFVYHELAVDA